jgi:hypothetical protein
MIDCASYRRYNGLHDDDLDQLHSHVDSSILDGLWSINPGADDDDEDELTHTPPMIRSLKRMVADARRQVKKSRSEGSTSKGKRFLNHLDLQVPIVSTTDALTKAFSLGQSLTEQQCMLSSPMVKGYCLKTKQWGMSLTIEKKPQIDGTPFLTVYHSSILC